jgi:hypothetical protein
MASAVASAFLVLTFLVFIEVTDRNRPVMGSYIRGCAVRAGAHG